jgi:hypothetical protein
MQFLQSRPTPSLAITNEPFVSHFLHVFLSKRNMDITINKNITSFLVVLTQPAIQPYPCVSLAVGRLHVATSKLVTSSCMSYNYMPSFPIRNFFSPYIGIRHFLWQIEDDTDWDNYLGPLCTVSKQQ